LEVIGLGKKSFGSGKFHILERHSLPNEFVSYVDPVFSFASTTVELSWHSELVLSSTSKLIFEMERSTFTNTRDRRLCNNRLLRPPGKAAIGIR